MPDQPATLADLCRRLEIGGPAWRREAARELREHGAEAVEPLCRALQDPDPEVRQLAVESLGSIGDPRAAPALVAALRRTFVARSGYLNASLGVAWGGGLILGNALIGAAGAALAAVLIAGLFRQALLALLAGGLVAWGVAARAQRQLATRQRNNRFCASISAALRSIAERHPTPELRAALPDLKAVALDVVQQERGTREAAKDAAMAIEALTASIRQLPVVGRLPDVEDATLPRPAEMSELGEPARLTPAASGPAREPALEEIADLGDLYRELRASSSPGERRRIAEALRRFSGQAVEELCAMLEAGDPEVQERVVECLGELGDPKAVPALIETLRRRFPGGSASAFQRQGALWAGGVVTTYLALGFFLIVLGIGLTVEMHNSLVSMGIVTAVPGVLGYVARHLFNRRRAENRIYAVFSEALARIAECQPTADVRTVLPDLRSISRDLIQQERSTRAAVRAAAARIDASTRDLGRLSASSEEAGVDRSVLARVGGRPEETAAVEQRVSHG